MGVGSSEGNERVVPVSFSSPMTILKTDAPFQPAATLPHPPRSSLDRPSRPVFTSFFSLECLWIGDDTWTRSGSFVVVTSTDLPGIVTRLAGPRVAPPLLKTKISSSSAPLWPSCVEQEPLQIVRPYWQSPRRTRCRTNEIVGSRLRWNARRISAWWWDYTAIALQTVADTFERRYRSDLTEKSTLANCFSSFTSSNDFSRFLVPTYFVGHL